MRLSRPVASFLVFLILFALPLVLVLKAASSESKPPQQADKTVPQTSLQATAETKTGQAPRLIIGDPDAPVTLIEYGDFQCPFCAQFFRQTEPQILANYVGTGQVKIEFRVETHIGEESELAGMAAYCANDQQAFKLYHDELYRRQSGYNSGTFSSDSLKRIARDLSLDSEVFNSCLDNEKHRSTVESSHAEAGRRGVTQTPTIFIGEHKVAGAQPYTVYKALLDEQL